VDARDGRKPVEGGLAARRHVFRLQTQHSGHDVVLDLAAHGQVQERPILRRGLEKRSPDFGFPG
jgi:hypothetical protein